MPLKLKLTDKILGAAANAASLTLRAKRLLWAMRVKLSLFIDSD